MNFLFPGRPRLIAPCRWLVLCFGGALSLAAQSLVLKQTVVPNRIYPTVFVVPSAWASQIPPSGTVNAPQRLTTLYPGQKIALALLCEGSDRDKLLRETRITARFTSPSSGAIETRDLKPAAIRRIKAEGSDMIVIAMAAAGIGAPDRTKLKEAMATQSLAVFPVDWTAPLTAKPQEIRISVTIAGGAPPVQANDAVLSLRPDADWLKATPPTTQEYGQYMNRYHADLAPGQQLAFLKGVAAEHKVNNLAVVSFFAIAYRENALARRAAIEAFPTLDAETKMALLLVLRLAGQDLSGLAASAPAGAVAEVQSLEPLRDPRAGFTFPAPLTPAVVGELGNLMDQCWAGWMATGNASYLRAMVSFLAWAPDYAVYQKALKGPPGPAGFNASVARGIAYETAGWSIGSFQRTDPMVMDWVLYWSNDPTFPPALRRELTALPTNPIFNRK